MKIATLQLIAVCCILAVAFMVAAPFVQTAEAKWTKKITYEYIYECLLKDGTVCIKPTTSTKIKYENGWWHQLWLHQDDHPQTEDTITKKRTEKVNGCSKCNPVTSF